MGYTISISEDGKYLWVQVNEPMTRKLAGRIGQEMNAAGARYGLRSYLYDVRNAPNIESPTANYFFAHEDMSSLQLDKSVRSAILASPDDHSHDFAETVLLNAGYIVRLFRDEAAAIAWLEGLDTRRLDDLAGRGTGVGQVGEGGR